MSKVCFELNDGRKIIVTTLQKFPVIYKEVNSTEGKRFAIIVDEAHSSQTGQSAQKLKIALADTKDALAEYAELEEKAAEEKRIAEEKATANTRLLEEIRDLLKQK